MIGIRRLVGLQWVSTCMLVSSRACRSPLGLRSRMSFSDETCQFLRRVSDRSPFKHIGLQWVFDNNNNKNSSNIVGLFSHSILGFHENIIIIGDTTKTYRRPIRDRHA